MLSRLTLPKAPPISGRQWLNSPPLTPEALTGRPVVLLFWAASCEASWVRLRQLERLRARHGDRVAVAAVHSPRFDYERDISVLRSIVERRGLTVPVLHDPDLETWARYGPTGRPTVVVSGRDQRVLGAVLGLDDEHDQLDDIVASEAALVDPGLQALPDLLGAHAPTSLQHLGGPTGLARLTDGRLAVVDRANSRLIVLELDHRATRGIVSTAFGGLDGATSIAARRDGSLAVSDPDAGTVDAIDLVTKKRRTIVDGLRRPTGLVEDRDGSLVICDAGADQILRVTSDRTGSIADAVSQPLDIVRIDAGLMFTEASTGALRLLTDTGQVRTINDGRRAGILDGPAHKAMFQRPAGLATLDGGRVAITDHGNSRLRLLADRRVTTVPITGLAHPEAVLYLGGERLLCSDTNNSRLVVADLASHRVTELAVHGLPI